MRQCFAILLPLLILAACSHTPSSAPSGKAPPDLARYDKLVIVGTNDVHGYIRPNEIDFRGSRVISGGAEWFAAYVRILENKYGNNLILLDGGDIFQGTIESNLFLGASTLRAFNELPYRAAAVGNHEFDYGPLQKGARDRLGALKARMREAKFPFLQANIFWKGTSKLWQERNLEPATIINAGGYKVGIIGLTTTSTPGKTLPQNVAALEFRDFLEPTREWAEKLRAQGAELVLITTHEGGEELGGPLSNLLNALPKGTIDAVVSGHSHTEVAAFVNGTPIIQARTRGLYFGRIDLFVDKTTRRVEPSLTKIHSLQPICGTWFAAEDHCDPRTANAALEKGAEVKRFLPLRTPSYEGIAVQPDLKMREVLRPYFAKAEVKSREQLGTATRDFEYFPSGESEMGQLFVRAFQWKYPEVKAVFLNGGGIRRRFFRGPMTYGDLYEVHPFDNYRVKVKMTGKQFRELVEVGVSGAQALPAVLGVRIKYHADEREEFERDLNGDGKRDIWERNRLVEVTWDDGRPLRDDEEFWVATIDYLLMGGDKLQRVFDPIPTERKVFGDQMSRDTVAEYLRRVPGAQRQPQPGPMRLEAVSGKPTWRQ